MALLVHVLQVLFETNTVTRASGWQGTLDAVVSNTNNCPSHNNTKRPIIAGEKILAKGKITAAIIIITTTAKQIKKIKRKKEEVDVAKRSRFPRE